VAESQDALNKTLGAIIMDVSGNLGHAVPHSEIDRLMEMVSTNGEAEHDGVGSGSSQVFVASVVTSVVITAFSQEIMDTKNHIFEAGQPVVETMIEQLQEKLAGEYEDGEIRIAVENAIARYRKNTSDIDKSGSES